MPFSDDPTTTSWTIMYRTPRHTALGEWHKYAIIEGPYEARNRQALVDAVNGESRFNHLDELLAIRHIPGCKDVVTDVYHLIREPSRFV